MIRFFGTFFTFSGQAGPVSRSIIIRRVIPKNVGYPKLQGNCPLHIKEGN
jgi:hypothetical protein